MKYLFMHVPKCAGTTIHKILMQNCPEGEFCPERFNGIHDMPRNELERYSFFSAHMDFATVGRIPGKKYTLTTLREPAARIVSLYKFWRSHSLEFAFRNKLHGPIAALSLPFTEFLKYQDNGIQANIRNSMVRNFLGRCWSDDEGALVVDDSAALDLALKNLSTFDLIGLTDDLTPMISALSETLGVEAPSVIPRENKTQSELSDDEFHTDEAVALLNELTSLDRIFFEQGRQLVAQRASEGSTTLMEKISATVLRKSSRR